MGTGLTIEECETIKWINSWSWLGKSGITYRNKYGFLKSRQTECYINNVLLPYGCKYCRMRDGVKCYSGYYDKIFEGLN